MAADEDGRLDGAIVVALLQRIPLLEGLSPRELRILARHVRLETFRPGEEIVTEGEMTGRCFLVVDGQAKVIIGGRPRRNLSTGAVIGELAIIDRGPRSATVVAESQVEALSLSSRTFLILLQEHWSVTRKVLVTLARRLRQAEKTLVS